MRVRVLWRGCMCAVAVSLPLYRRSSSHICLFSLCACDLNFVVLCCASCVLLCYVLLCFVSN